MTLAPLSEPWSCFVATNLLAATSQRRYVIKRRIRPRSGRLRSRRTTENPTAVMIRQGILHRNAWLGLIQLKTSQGSFDSITARIREAVIPLRWQVALQLLSWYIGTNITEIIIEIERVQTGVRIEKRLLKVLKAVSELKDMTLG